MALSRCPICRKEFERSESTAMPFCSDRCRLIDLGRWMGEQYSVPADDEPNEEDPSFLDPPNPNGL